MRRLRNLLFPLFLPFLAPAAVPPAGGLSLGHTVIRIAIQSPLTGNFAHVGQDIQNGVQLAIEQRATPLATLGFEVQAAPFDDRADPAVGVANAKTLVHDPAVLAVVGHFNSSVELQASEQYHAAQLCNLSPAGTHPRITDRGYPEINRICCRDDMQGAAAARYAQSRGIRQVAVLHDKSWYGIQVAMAFERTARVLGIEVTGFLGTDEAGSYEPILAPLLEGKPGCLFFGGMYDRSAPLFRQARELGFEGLCLSDDGFDTPDSARLGGDALLQGAGTSFTILGAPVWAYPGTRPFVADFERRFGHKPYSFAAQAYDCASMALLAIENAARANGGTLPSRAQVAQAVRDIRDFPGITGPVSFNGTGDHIHPRYFVVRVGGADESQWNQNRLETAYDVPPPSGLPAAFRTDTASATFNLGVVAPMTGEAASFGDSMKRGVDLAVAEWNAKGGVLGKPIRTCVADDRGDPGECASVFPDLIIKDRVSAIIGPVMSKVGLAGAPICQAAGVPMLSPTATNPLLTQAGTFIFRACFIDPFQGIAGARFAFRDLKARRAACLFDVGNDYTKGLSAMFKDEFERLGGGVAAFEGHATGEVDFRPQLRRMLAAHPQVLYISDYYNDAVLAIKQARLLGFTGPVVGGDGWDSPKFAGVGGKAVENTYYTNHYTPDDRRPAVRAFIARYRSANGPREPDALAALGYDAANLMLEAVRQAGRADGDSIRLALQALNINTICGPVHFDQDRNAIKPVVVLRTTSGKPVYQTTIAP